MPFDFDAAVTAPFRMQPGLRRLAAGAQQLTPLAPGSRHQREKLAVLSAFWRQALGAVPGFDAAPALAALFMHAAQEHADAWAWDGGLAVARRLGTAVGDDGELLQLQAGAFGLGDEVARCLAGLPPAWRQAGLASLAFAEDFAIVDGTTGTIPWLAVTLPSHWAPEEKLGRHFTEVHAPVADNTLLLKATAGLLRLATGTDRWERFVWNVSDHPRLHAHPARVDPQRWQHTAPAEAWLRSEHQTFIPLPERAQTVFTIHVEVQPLAQVLGTPRRAATLHDAIASMSPAVLAYRSLGGVREPLLAWLASRASQASTAAADAP
ncbi:MAG: hypothetical protein C0505_03105 [Leptothrix sp. (in: Bacteria)]|nr:hypothetical protein [Leptothrix sp. (in: b-proteobacteria)]